ncbi:MAG: hypothetical protein MI923_05180 [Phycisphaerales bacterium]|nr:hypothetical protein [Phycisphaerales bacterium]
MGWLARKRRKKSVWRLDLGNIPGGVANTFPDFSETIHPALKCRNVVS